MSDVSDHEVIEEMERTGGGYVKALAWAYLKADRDNRRLLQPAFGKYRAEYAARVVQRREQELVDAALKAASESEASND